MTYKRRQKTSLTIVNRLPRYLRCLQRLREKQVERTSSTQIAELLGTTASQVRQDFSTFGTYGATGYGYNTNSLIREIEHIIGLDDIHKIAVVGIGGIGHAMLEHMDFSKHNYVVEAAFDVDSALVGTDVNGITIYHVNQLEEILNDADVDICMLTVPQNAAREIAKRVYDLAIPAIWNFTGVDLELDPEGVIVQEVNFWDSLLALTFCLEDFNRQE